MLRWLVDVRIGSARLFFVFFFNDTATTEIYTLSLHDALPIYSVLLVDLAEATLVPCFWLVNFKTSLLIFVVLALDRKSTRLNSSHANISYAVFCLKKKRR